ncbi:MAG: endolytic transglycosylase MltG [Ignavibacteriaceae bacterium]|nr:endolytic transglycosylase MltG [Ignavibacteriaceae bacterium]
MKKLFTKKEIVAILVVFTSIISLGYCTFFTSNYYSADEAIIFEIKDGESFITVANRLINLNVIPSKTNFRIAAFIYGAEKNIKAARYNIPNGLSYLELLDLFIYGPADFLRNIRVNDGQTIKWLSAKVRRDLRVDSAAFANTARNPEFIKSLGLEHPTMEGYLFPGNYKIYERSSPEEVIKIFFQGFNDFWNDTLKSRAKEIGLSIHQVITLASIVKGETHRVEEMPRIAGVYYNRLKFRMRLQADPTIQYLLPGGWRRLLYKDLNIESPYNTYKYAGLPPGPINNPGKNPILAVLYPEKHNYLYFVASVNGGHKFARTYSEHLKYVREYRKWLRSQQIK